MVRKNGQLLCGLIIAALVAVAGAAAGSTAPPQDADAEIQRLQRDYESAERAFNSIDQPDSIAMFGRIITVLERRLLGGADPVARAMLVNSLAFRARANFNGGNRAGAEGDVRALIAADPTATLDRIQMSPRFLELFDSIQAGMVGYFEFAVSPRSAEIHIDGRLLEPSVMSYSVVAGSHAVVVEQPGYRAVQEELQVAAGDSVLVDYALVRVSAVVRILTRPAGAVIVVDGVAQGTTSGVAPPDFAPTGAAALFPSSDFSDELVIENLQPGSYTVDVSLEGFRPRRYDLHVADIVDYNSVIVLEETSGDVVLEGLTAAAEVTIDGVAATPQWPASGAAARLSLPPGTHLIEVSQGTTGVFATSVEVQDQQTKVVEVRLRPGLAFLGVLGGDERGSRDLRALLTAQLGAIDNWTVLDRTWAAPVFESIQLTTDVLRAAAELPTGAPDWAEVQATMDREAPGTVYMLAVLNDDLLATYADLWIWTAAPGPPQPDRVRVGVESSADIAVLAGGFQTSALLAGTWLGALMVDVGDATVVISVTAGGPAESAGLRVGDRVVSIGGTVVAGAAAAGAIIDGATAGAALAVQVQRGAATEVIEVTLGSSPRVISFSDRALVYSVISASLAAEASGAAPSWVVQLNQAAVLMHAGVWDGAVRTLRGIEGAPSGPGVGESMVQYWLGIALTALGPGYRDSAAQAFQRAAAEPDARLFHNDGPWVAPRAVARLSELGGR